MRLFAVAMSSLLCAAGCYVRGVEVVGSSLALLEAVATDKPERIGSADGSQATDGFQSPRQPGCELAGGGDSLGPTSIHLTPDGSCEAVVWTTDGRLEGGLRDGLAHGVWRR